MPEGLYLGFDFGYRRIGVAVGQQLTGSASPLSTIKAKFGVPNWEIVQKLIDQWKPIGIVVGLPTTIDNLEQYTTKAARHFSQQLQKRFRVPVYLVDERLSTIEARSHLFAEGGYRKLSHSEIDSVAACIILEQWLRH